MSIENNMSSIAQSLASIAKSLETLVAKQKEATDVIVEAVKHTPAAAPVQVVVPESPAIPVPNMTAALVVPPVQQAVPPAPFVQPVQPVATPDPAFLSGSAAPSLPFTDGKGLMTYVMGKYKALGPVKGGEIQGVLTSLGYKNINEVKAEHYQEFYNKVEAL